MARKRKAFEDIFGMEKRRQMPPANTRTSPNPADTDPGPACPSPAAPSVTPRPDTFHSIDSEPSVFSTPSAKRVQSRNGQRLAFRNFLQQNSSNDGSFDSGASTSSTIQVASAYPDSGTADGCVNRQNDSEIDLPGPGVDHESSSISVPTSVNVLNSTSQNSLSHSTTDRSNFGLSVMAQVILNRDSLEFTPLDPSALETIVETVQATIGSPPQNDATLADVFNDPRLRHRSVIDASLRIQSLQKDMENHLSALHGLSPDSEPIVIQNVLGRAERAARATSSDLRKGATSDTYVMAMF
ncbi:uncharacterized protein C8R40DRAFT_1069548 [Lentinula edodes]|uniref:uncharacterized protein n=1 Tax=Lentinula edodes TaxID=5353 RepID=UPI001E8E5603|nr:uncharacterized protein C8R40DRAFT_1069548 [Lentinula edodes]KAH7875031.1 hypothetical protein C8R40DRAFT_1069548 [Lentinula edodes]